MGEITVTIEPTLKNLREHKHLTQRELAEMIGLDVARYNMLENITPDLLAKAAKALGVKPDDIKLVS